MFSRLVEEFGTLRELLIWLVGLATRTAHPVALHMAGMTTVLSPPGWNRLRLEGWLAVHAQALEQQFGRIDGWHSSEEATGLS